MNPPSHRLKWTLMIVSAGLLLMACSLISRVQEKAQDAVEEAIATQIDQAIPDVDLGDIEATAQAVATEIMDEGLQETLQAAVTEALNEEDLQATVEALATVAPTELDDLQATADAFQDGFQMGEAPPDIPVLPIEKENFFGTKDLVSYFVDLAFADVLDFYKKEMPNNGWTEKEMGSFVSQETAVLQFEKPDRDAIVTISVDPSSGKTIVLISIQTK